MNKVLLKSIMKTHGDCNADLASAINMSAPNFSTIWNGRADFSLKRIKIISKRYNLSAQQVYDIFIAN
jgi:antitoxin component HigA of HigAB toxin-antitoxin module